MSAPLSRKIRRERESSRNCCSLARERARCTRQRRERVSAIDVLLIDGTYELFRHFYALPSALAEGGQEVAAVRGVLASLLHEMQKDKTYIAVATDHVIESFRNDMWPGYKDGTGTDPALLSQFALLEEALTALGVVVWPMEEYEADDALASGARLAAMDKRVDRVLICTPDKDLAQSVQGKRVVQVDRRRKQVRDEAGVIAKFGVEPASIPDYLALVGDTADGFPGLDGWGPKSTAAILSKFHHLEGIPADPQAWKAPVASSRQLAETLQAGMNRALLFRDIATLRADIALFDSVEQLRWRGPTAAFEPFARRLEAAVSARGKQTARRPQR